MLQRTKRYIQQHPNQTEDFWRLFRFGITGSVSSLIHYASYCLALLWLGVTTSYTIGYLIGLLCNYALTTYFTFHRRPSRSNAIGFVGSHIINYLLEIGLLELFLLIGLNEWIAPIAVMVIVVPINFLLLRYVFVHSPVHLLFVHDKGQMCNNIIQFSHVYAWALEHHRHAISLRFSYKYRYFHICQKWEHNALVYVVVKLLSKLHILPTVVCENYWATQEETSRALSSHPVMVVTGWHIRFYDYFEKHLDKIIRLFTFKKSIESQVHELLASRCRADDVLLGVHIRRGDYDKLLNGRYFYQDDVFIQAIRHFHALLPDKHLVVVVCGNTRLDKRGLQQAVPEAEFIFPDGTPAVDLCTLSHCNYLLGPPSSYSLVASMYRNTPLYFILKPHSPFTLEDFHPFFYQLRHFDQYFEPDEINS